MAPACGADVVELASRGFQTLKIASEVGQSGRTVRGYLAGANHSLKGRAEVIASTTHLGWAGSAIQARRWQPGDLLQARTSGH